MSVSTETRIKWTSADLELLPENGNNYEIIDGELYMTRAPHWKHQTSIARITNALVSWSNQSKLGQTIINPGIIFSDDNNVIPDLIWISNKKLESCVDEAGHFTSAPELVVEILSQKPNDIKRDKETKLKLYSNRGVREYWIVDWQLKQVEIYRRYEGKLTLMITLLDDDSITSELLPNFSCQIRDFFL
ncbi:Uma2 family endonuclease [Geminocystis herdmanii]|uniref:Uma2 family endonuclease n=1 Tax=Geminocystis herdmanii TaxID=669359 RepID=UPI00034D65FD|nr:Uma2 family endonuclease [Geminocystis herdmanii]